MGRGGCVSPQTMVMGLDMYVSLAGVSLSHKTRALKLFKAVPVIHLIICPILKLIWFSWFGTSSAQLEYPQRRIQKRNWHGFSGFRRFPNFTAAARRSSYIRVSNSIPHNFITYNVVLQNRIFSRFCDFPVFSRLFREKQLKVTRLGFGAILRELWKKIMLKYVLRSRVLQIIFLQNLIIIMV